MIGCLKDAVVHVLIVCVLLQWHCYRPVCQLWASLRSVCWLQCFRIQLQQPKQEGLLLCYHCHRRCRRHPQLQLQLLQSIPQLQHHKLPEQLPSC